MIASTFSNVITHHAQAENGVNWGVISWNKYAADELNIVQSNALNSGRGRTAAAQNDQPTGPRTPLQAPRGWPPPRRVLLPHCLRRWLQLRRQLLLLQLSLFYSDSDAETAWPPSVIVIYPHSRTAVLSKTSHANCCTTLTNRPSRLLLQPL